MAFQSDLLTKLPSSFLNLATYFRYNIVTEKSICFVLGNLVPEIKSALQPSSADGMPPGLGRPHRSTNPRQMVDIIVSEIVALMEPERRIIDVHVQELQAKTGMSALVFNESQRAATNEDGTLLKDLHICEGRLGFFERTTQFQVGWIEWLQLQHSTLLQHRFGTCEMFEISYPCRPAEECIASSLALCASFSRERLEQVKTGQMYGDPSRDGFFLG